jgi:hypothetical protein
MHYIHLIAVEADNSEEAIKKAEQALSPYGDGDVWDYYEVGGRWNGELEGKDALCYSENSDAFVKHLDKCKERRNQELTNILNLLKGVEDQDGEEGNTEYRKQIAADFKKIMDLTEVPENFGVGMAGYYLYKIGMLLSDIYHGQSYFFDAVLEVPNLVNVLTRCEKSPERQWLVAVDLHN